MVDIIVSFFSHEVFIKIKKDECEYDDGKNKLKIKTKVFLSKNNTIIAGVGSYDGNEYVTCVDVFDDIDYTGILKFEILERYFRFAIEQLHNRKSFIRSKVIVESTKDLKSLLNGYEEYVIKEALLAAGAYSVYFLDTQNKYKVRCR